jgi:putative YhbY family RNA-binding protein
MFQLRQANAVTHEKERGEIEDMSKLTAGKKRFVKRTLSEESPTILIGKNGISDEVLKEVEKQLEKREMVKVKLLGTALKEGGAKQIATRIAERIEASLVEVRGHTFMLYRRRKK